MSVKAKEQKQKVASSKPHSSQKSPWNVNPYANQTKPFTTLQSAQMHSRLLTPQDVVPIQKTIGNCAIGRILSQSTQPISKISGFDKPVQRHALQSGRRAANITYLFNQAQIIQSDLAIPPPNPTARVPTLSRRQIRRAMRYNRRNIRDPYMYAVIRDMVGLPRFPAVLTEDLVRAIAGWQARRNQPATGRIDHQVIDSIAAELRAESRLVPALSRDAELIEVEPGLSFNPGIGLNAASIRILQRLMRVPRSGRWDIRTVQGVRAWQQARRLTVDGKVGRRTQRSMIMALARASRFDDAIRVIIDLYNYPTANLTIRYDRTVAAFATTAGTIGTGNRQTVRVGPSAFTRGFTFLVRTIGHEIQHVQQRSGAVPIRNQPLREFLAWSWEALHIGNIPQYSPRLRVWHARRSLTFWARMPAPLQRAHAARHRRVQALIRARGRGRH